jgi:Tol biopolymer transport system component
MSSPINPDIVYRLINVSAPDMSKDGKYLTFTKSWVDEQELEDKSQIELASLADGSIVQFTHGRKDSHPLFSHDEAGGWSK